MYLTLRYLAMSAHRPLQESPTMQTKGPSFIAAKLLGHAESCSSDPSYLHVPQVRSPSTRADHQGTSSTALRVPTRNNDYRCTIMVFICLYRTETVQLKLSSRDAGVSRHDRHA